ncbi:DUF4097 family beta strand repeat-containing protein [Alteromonas facilis]|uniref:DUF4097 family beta strand repeat-containing protein n=1 Tax=Alteromonas facilis TaxID=2048004 RepID=UPI000C28B7D9|nr:DUF4097 family beta strand repeat-containing protein [Alteromonas facilis]
MKSVTRVAATTLAIASAATYSLMAMANTFEQTYDVQPGETLYIKTDVGTIDIRTQDTDRVEIEVDVDGRNADELDVRFEQTSNGISVYGERESSGWGWNGSQIRARFTIVVPESFNIDVNTAGGSIKVEDLVGNVDAKTSGGSISLGDIKGDIDVHTSGGSIRVDSVYGDIQAHTSGGSINVDFKQQITQDAKLTTSGGSITAYLPEDIQIDLSASTSGGSVRSEFDVDGKVTKRSIRGEINGGGPELTLRTSGGSVKIHKD